jgi:hypothetical protein
MPSTSLIPTAQIDITINCAGIGEVLGKQLSDVLNVILQERLDATAVLAKLNEVERVPEEGIARTVSDEQSQLIIKNLTGKPAAVVSMSAHPLAEDSAGFAQALALPLAMVGWQIEGGQIRRRAPKNLEPVTGLALIVKDRNAPPQKAVQLRTALAAAKIGSSLVSDPSLGAEAVMIWIGRRAELPPAEPPK